MKMHRTPSTNGTGLREGRHTPSEEVPEWGLHPRMAHLRNRVWKTKASISAHDLLCRLSASPFSVTVDSNKLEYGPGTIYAGFSSFSRFWVGDSHVPTFWLLL